MLLFSVSLLTCSSSFDLALLPVSSCHALVVSSSVSVSAPVLGVLNSMTAFVSAAGLAAVSASVLASMPLFVSTLLLAIVASFVSVVSFVFAPLLS